MKKVNYTALCFNNSLEKLHVFLKIFIFSFKKGNKHVFSPPPVS